MQVIVGSTGLRAAPRKDAALETELLFGEEFFVEKSKSGWGYGHAKLDNYAGYVDLTALADNGPRSTHRVSVLRTIVYTHADFKSTPVLWLSMNARVRVSQSVPLTNGFVQIVGSGWVFLGHLAPVTSFASDWVFEAEKYYGEPYFWGGRDANHGVDCSGLIQNAHLAAGHYVPRNTNQQEAALKSRLDLTTHLLSSLERGELVFWKGHVGVMVDDTHLLHATADFMQVVREPLEEAIARRKYLYGTQPITVGRLA